ncbi:MAG TPA: ATP-dependent protease ATPase subunit HslU [Thermotogota bacterium]|nr:ATP-dependent protease ATPase subunit HslU [Thermotogota bacterium]HPJ87526.1 ATP-dependent protease ATPase subunit HslU [Thermotogota bacterium]HPR94731.1 ATP-dependent protease ATPase subunit HslU [Thermotogota bacterium]
MNKALPGIDELTPKMIVSLLDKYIVGQNDAKKSVAIALRNRIRRQKLDEEMKKEVFPKNILMIGPTGVGKTEIARRLANLSDSPFIKVEATRFTEVGYVGRSVESMIRELVEAAISKLKLEEMSKVQMLAEIEIEKIIVEAILHPGRKPKNQQNLGNIFGQFFQGNQSAQSNVSTESEPSGDLKWTREEVIQKLRNGEFDDRFIDIDVEQSNSPQIGMMGTDLGDMGIDMQGMFGNLMPKKIVTKRVSVSQARKILLPIESEKLIDEDKIVSDGLEIAQNKGIVFIDEIDKVAGESSKSGPDVSRGGVQRDLLPIVEGTTVMTKYGMVKTDFILFIAAGAFHTAKPSDLIPELQGRFPLRVELESLTQEDFKRILVEPRNSLTKQYKALLATDGVEIEFTDGGLDELAAVSFRLNEELENIGARRLYTVMEKILEEISFEAPAENLEKLVVDRNFVNEHISEFVQDRDLSAYIL